METRKGDREGAASAIEEDKEICCPESQRDRMRQGKESNRVYQVLPTGQVQQGLRIEFTHLDTGADPDKRC